LTARARKQREVSTRIHILAREGPLFASLQSLLQRITGGAGLGMDFLVIVFAEAAGIVRFLR
jgi:hypothetical protein